MMETSSERGIAVARVAAALPEHLGEPLAAHEQRFAAFERVADVQARAHDLLSAAERADAQLM